MEEDGEAKEDEKEEVCICDYSVHWKFWENM